jgi:hypothetical protein
MNGQRDHEVGPAMAIRERPLAPFFGCAGNGFDD